MSTMLNFDELPPSLKKACIADGFYFFADISKDCRGKYVALCNDSIGISITSEYTNNSIRGSLVKNSSNAPINVCKPNFNGAFEEYLSALHDWKFGESTISHIDVNLQSHRTSDETIGVSKFLFEIVGSKQYPVYLNSLDGMQELVNIANRQAFNNTTNVMIDIVNVSGLSNLIGLNTSVDIPQNLLISGCNLSSLEGLPTTAQNLSIADDNLDSVAGISSIIYSDLNIALPKLKSLSNIDDHIHQIGAKHFPQQLNRFRIISNLKLFLSNIETGILSLLLIPNSTFKTSELRIADRQTQDEYNTARNTVFYRDAWVNSKHQPMWDIINSYTTREDDADHSEFIYECQNKLIEAGFASYAEL